MFREQKKPNALKYHKANLAQTFVTKFTKDRQNTGFPCVSICYCSTEVGEERGKPLHGVSKFTFLLTHSGNKSLSRSNKSALFHGM